MLDSCDNLGYHYVRYLNCVAFIVYVTLGCFTCCDNLHYRRELERKLLRRLKSLSRLVKLKSWKRSAVIVNSNSSNLLNFAYKMIVLFLYCIVCHSYWPNSCKWLYID